jgi:hypothetical protein
MRFIFFAFLAIWIAVAYFRRPRVSSAPLTTNILINKVLRILMFVTITLGALWKEAEQRYYSSPVPDTQLGRTVADEGIHGDTIYITPEADRLQWAWFAICVIIFVLACFWPSKEKTNDAA